MGIVTRHGHVQRINHIHRRLSTAEDRIDEVIPKVAMRTTVSAWRDTWRQGVFLGLQPFGSRLLESLLSCGIAHETVGPSVVPVVSRILAPEAVGLLEGFSWPGNVRQLEHVINQVLIVNPGDELKAGMLPAEIREARPAVVMAAHHLAADMPGSFPTIQEMERQLILGALQQTSGSVPDAAKRLGLSPATLYRKVKKSGISRAWLETEGRTVSQ